MKATRNFITTALRSVVAGAAALGIAGTALLAGQAGASAATATTGVGVQLLDGSAPQTSWMEASIARGGSRTWHVKMTDSGTISETVAAVASSSLSVVSGGPAKQPASTLQPWISYSPSQAVLAPGQSMTVAVTVTVPAGAPLGLVAGYCAGNTSLSVNTFWAYAYPAGGQVQMANATGVRMYITVIPAS
jgi:hypothetical protein